MRLHLVPVELRLWIIQYYLVYHLCIWFTWIAPFSPIDAQCFLHNILRFSGFFPRTVAFLLVTFLTLFCFWSRGVCHWCLETYTSWSFPSVYYYLLVWAGFITATLGTHAILCCGRIYQTLACSCSSLTNIKKNLIIHEICLKKT